MKYKKIFKILVKEIHSSVMATVDEHGLPATRVIDIMHYDDNGLYFLTAKGKSFYKQLQNKPYVSLSAMTNGRETLAKKAISLSGAIRPIGTHKLDVIFENNPYMEQIYPTPESRTALEVFYIYTGHGEFFDLTTKPITRENFAFGGEKVKQLGFFITDDCTSCNKCTYNCPTDCITVGKPFVIDQAHCLHCGNCFEACPSKVITRA